MEIIVAWLVSVMLAFSPAVTGERYTNPDARESATDRTARYEGMARAVVAVAFDPAERPLFAGPWGRHQTATLLLGVAWKEGSWRRDVDLGEGKRARGGGTDSCNMQIRLASWRDRDGTVHEQTTPEGWTWRDLVTDREKCFRAGLRMLRRSMGACRAEDPDHALAAYARGVCTDPVGQAKSRERIRVGRQLFGLRPAPAAPALGGGS